MYAALRRYITDRFLPDKAIDLIDEAAAKLKMEITSKPLALDELDRRILQLDMERLSLSKAAAKDRAAAERLEGLDRELAGLRERQQGLNAQWESERSDMMALTNIKEEVERVNLEVQQACTACLCSLRSVCCAVCSGTARERLHCFCAALCAPAPDRNTWQRFTRRACGSFPQRFLIPFVRQNRSFCLYLCPAH